MISKQRKPKQNTTPEKKQHNLRKMIPYVLAWGTLSPCSAASSPVDQQDPRNSYLRSQVGHKLKPGKARAQQHLRFTASRLAASDFPSFHREGVVSQTLNLLSHNDQTRTTSDSPCVAFLPSLIDAGHRLTLACVLLRFKRKY